MVGFQKCLTENKTSSSPSVGHPMIDVAPAAPERLACLARPHSVQQSRWSHCRIGPNLERTCARNQNWQHSSCLDQQPKCTRTVITMRHVDPWGMVTLLFGCRQCEVLEHEVLRHWLGGQRTQKVRHIFASLSMPRCKTRSRWVRRR